MDPEDYGSNNSGNRPFHEVLRASRRRVLSGSLAAAATGFFASSAAIAKPPWLDDDDDDDEDRGRGRGRGRGHRGRELIHFDPVEVSEGAGPEPAISSDYEFDVLIPWGDPIEPGGPDYNPRNPGENDPAVLAQRAKDQAYQFGIGHDGMTYFPIKHKRGYGDDDERGRHGIGNDVGMIAINHEFGTNYHVLGKNVPESLEEVRISQHAHGVSVAAIARWRGKWRTLRSKNSRRIHGNTPVCFSGPAASSPLLQTPAGNPPLGTLNNCSNGETPWGTYLTCEENSNGYFGSVDENDIPTTMSVSPWAPSEEQERYGYDDDGFGYYWHKFDKRFDLGDPNYKNEENRFHWVVEIDPFDATQTPVKRTALGRFKHEGVALTVGRGGRVVCYMGDDERFDYIYKFVSDRNWKAMRAQGLSPLDHGKLYVARFNDDGTGDWLELTMDNPDLAARFADEAEMLIYARIAGDIVGATPMDRPEWTTVAPDGRVYCTLTNNSQRDDVGFIEKNGRLVDSGPNAANPIAENGPGNADGHIIRWEDADDHVGTTFKWDIYLISRDTHGTDSTFSDPDGLWADPDGRIFIQTDGGQKEGLNNQMLVAEADDSTNIRRLFTGVSECEITGLTTTPDRRTAFINIQHPGDGDPAITNFPAPQGSGQVPRDATIVLRRKDGGIVGS